jgi:hypothetical protein
MAQPLVYRRYGGSLQVSIPSFQVLTEAIRIPETQWFATVCPIEGLNCDPRFLAFVDSDQNGRIRVSEVRAAVELAARLLRSYAGVDAGSDVLELDALSDEGAKLREAAGLLLKSLQAEERTRISLEQVRASEKALREAGHNGDGIVAPAFLPEPVQGLAKKILGCFPEVKNRAGQAGIDLPMLERFRQERAELLAHLGRKESTFVWGEQGLERARRIREVRPLLDAYFLQCRLVAAQPEAAMSLKLEAERVAQTLGSPEALARAVSELPIAPPEPAGVLTWSRLYRGPAFEKLEAFRRDIAAPLAGGEERLGDTGWHELAAKAEAIAAWQARLEASPLRGLAGELAGLAEADLEAIAAACQADLALEDRLKAVSELERLILYQRWLLKLANNFISMPELFTPKRRALMEKGVLILGGYRYTLAVLVTHRASHVALTSQGTTCTLYAKLTAREGEQGYEVALPVTRGRSRELTVGKRGVFYDTEGKEYDATVTEVIRQPVSLWEAMTLPFTRVSHFIAAKIEGLASAGDKELEAQLEQRYAKGSTLVAGAAAPASGAPAPAPPAPGAPAPSQPMGGLGGAVAGVGFAVAAVGSSLAFIVTQLRALTFFDLFSVATLLAALVMVPAGLLGWIKLRKRNLALLLEGSGWALNDRLKLTHDMAALVTRRPKLPKGATVQRTDVLRALWKDTRDDNEEEGISWGAWLVLALAILFVVLWQAREPLIREACERQWLDGSTCASLLSPGTSPAAPPVPPGPPAPARP